MRTIRNTELEAVPEERRLRRHRSKLERRQVVEETMRPGAPSVAVIARAHGVNANQVFNWRKLYHEGRLNDKVQASELLPVRISEDSNPDYSGVGRLTVAPVVAGAIRIEIGRARIRVEGPVDPATLRIILEQLGR
jgi:transposase